MICLKWKRVSTAEFKKRKDWAIYIRKILLRKHLQTAMFGIYSL